jgi:hypothetical protein
VVHSLRQHGTLHFIVADFSPQGEKSATEERIATTLPKAKQLLDMTA